MVLLLFPFGMVSAKEGTVTEQAHTLMQQFFDESNTPGLAVAVGMGGKVIWSQGYGHADVEQMVKVDPAQTLVSLGQVFAPTTH